MKDKILKIRFVLLTLSILQKVLQLLWLVRDSVAPRHGLKLTFAQISVLPL